MILIFLIGFSASAWGEVRSPPKSPIKGNSSIFSTNGNAIQQNSQLILYDHWNFNGDSETISVGGSGCTNVQHLNDRASSAKVSEGCVRLWQDLDCGGPSLDVPAPGSDWLEGFNDVTTSISSCDFPCYKEGIEINIHLNGAEDLREHAEQAKKVMQEWFPFIQSQLYTPAYRTIPKIDLYYDEKDGNGNDFVAYAWVNEIHIHQGYIRWYKEYFGIYVHEMTHVIHTPRAWWCPGWIVEGTAEYMRRWFYEPETTPTKPTSEEIAAYSGDWLLYYLTTVIKKPIFYQITKACQEGTYTDNWLKDRTGKTPEEWWTQMINDENYPWKRVR